MLDFFNKIKKHKLKFGNAYAVQMGDYAGQMFIFVQSIDGHHEFLSSPEMINRTITVEKFDFALKEGIIEYVERLPKFVRNITRTQFEQNQKQDI